MCLREGISYPNKLDIENAKEHGKPAGGDIKIHGYKNGLGFIGKFLQWSDWTFGCIALTNDDVDELYKVAKIGTMIEINYKRATSNPPSFKTKNISNFKF
jgi:murein L,D-transpeptidase YafK